MSLVQGACIRGIETPLFTGDALAGRHLSPQLLLQLESVNRCSVSPDHLRSIQLHDCNSLPLSGLSYPHPLPFVSLYSLSLQHSLDHSNKEALCQGGTQIIVQSRQVPVYRTYRKKPPHPYLVSAFTASKISPVSTFVIDFSSLRLMGSLEHNFKLQGRFCFVLVWFLFFSRVLGTHKVIWIKVGQLSNFIPALQLWRAQPGRKIQDMWPLWSSLATDTEQRCLETQNKWTISLKVFYFECGTASCQWVTPSVKKKKCLWRPSRPFHPEIAVGRER